MMHYELWAWSQHCVHIEMLGNMLAASCAACNRSGHVRYACWFVCYTDIAAQALNNMLQRVYL